MGYFSKGVACVIYYDWDESKLKCYSNSHLEQFYEDKHKMRHLYLIFTYFTGLTYAQVDDIKEMCEFITDLL